MQEDQIPFRALLNQLPDSVFLKDRHHRFRWGNAAKARHHDITPKTMVSYTDFDYYPEAVAEQTSTQDDERVMQTGEPLVNQEEQVTHANGSRPAWNEPKKTGNTLGDHP